METGTTKSSTKLLLCIGFETMKRGLDEASPRGLEETPDEPSPPSLAGEPFKIKRSSTGAKCSMGVGVAAIVTNHEQHPGCVLLGKRVGSDGSGTWALPGGHLEFGESFEACAAREVEEETGCKTRAAALLCVDNAIDAAASYHYVVPFVVCRTRDEPENKEPTKCEGWRWQRWDDPDFPAPLFTALANVRRRGLEVPFAASGEDEAAPPADEARGAGSEV